MTYYVRSHVRPSRNTAIQNVTLERNKVSRIAAAIRSVTLREKEKEKKIFLKIELKYKII